MSSLRAKGLRSWTSAYSVSLCAHARLTGTVSLGASFSSEFWATRSDTLTGVFHILPPAASSEKESIVFTKATNILHSTLKLAWDSIGGWKALEGSMKKGTEK